LPAFVSPSLVLQLRMSCFSFIKSSEPAANPAREFKTAVRQMKQAQRLVRQTVASLRKAELRPVRPTRPSLSSRAELWSWYRRRGLSYARFVADHGMG
jgi:hypothetical protein